MSEHREVYGADRAVLSDFPEAVRASLHLVKKNPSNEAGLILLQCVASASHPDYLFNLAMLSSLPEEYKKAAFELVEWSLKIGLTVDQKAAILRYVEPLLISSIRPPQG